MDQQKGTVAAAQQKRTPLDKRFVSCFGALIAGVIVLLMLAWRTATPQTLEARLSAALTQMEGAGSVEVVIYQKEETEDVQASTVFSALGGNGKTLRPGGVLVLAQGADDLKVRMQIISAVQALLDVPASHIEVLKKTD